MADEITPNPQTPQTEPISEPVEATIPPEPETAQIPVYEPLTEPANTEIKPEEKPLAPSEHEPVETKPEPEQPSAKSENIQPNKEVIPVTVPTKNLARELLAKARNMIQFRKRKKLDKIMTLFTKKSPNLSDGQVKITNDEVEKFLHVSDATATRYLNTLEKEGKIKQSGKTGRSAFYTLK